MEEDHDHPDSDNPEKRKENNKINRDLAYNSSWLYRIFRDYRLSKRDKANIIKSYKQTSALDKLTKQAQELDMGY